MQAVAGQVEAYGRLVLMNINVNLDIGLAARDARSLPAALAKLVDNRVLGAQRDKMAVI